MDERPGYVDRYRRHLGYSVAAAGGLYILAAVATDGTAVLTHLGAQPPAVLTLALLLPSIGFLARFLRWDLYLRHLGHRLAPLRHLRIYLAGFALTTTPGKVGENLRAFYLQQEGVPYAQSVAAFVAERLGDLLAVILLAGLAGGLLGRVGWLLALSCGVTLMAFLAVRHPRLPAAVEARVTGSTLPGRVALGAARSLAHARLLLSGRLLVPGVGAAVVAWGAEGCAFVLLSRGVGIELSFVTGVGVFAVATLLGAVSFLPGGLGATEATLGGLLVAAGGSLPEATAATILTRAFTLWWAVLLGVVAMVRLGDAPGTPASEGRPT